MMKRISRYVACLAVLILLGLIGPGGTWIQARRFWADARFAPEALYLVAGEKDQDRRVDALLTYTVQPKEGRHAPPLYLVGNDDSTGPFSRQANRALSVAEWAQAKLETAVVVPTEIVPGTFSGTDGEMAALAAYLDAKPEIKGVALVTSPYHIRRALCRLKAHLKRPVDVRAVRADPQWSDRAPWTVAAELAKLVRDSAGLSTAPFVSRKGWMKKPAHPPEKPQRQ